MDADNFVFLIIITSNKSTALVSALYHFINWMAHKELSQSFFRF